jgi:flagellar biosynthesis/type III secretory pathway protein FliH
MAKVIKGGGAPAAGGEEIGVITPDTGFADIPRKKPAIVSKESYEAGNEARKIVSDAEAKAQAAIAQAEGKAQEIIAEAQKEAEELKGKAHGEGFTQGSNEAASKYTEIIASHSKRMEQKEAEVANQIRQLALAIAK